jgi:imidazolonepropionase-like amidohydrolase
MRRDRRRVRWPSSNIALIDGRSDTVRAQQTVIVRGDRIVAVGPAAETEVPRGAHRIDGRGRWLMPGLWDMHVHAFPLDFEDFSGALMLAWGVTGARDMGFYVDTARFWRGEVAAGRVAGPRMVVGGRLDGPVNRAPWVTRAATDAEARRAVDSLADAGADFIKVYSSLGRIATSPRRTRRAAAGSPSPAMCRTRSRCWRRSARASGASSTRTT